MTESSLRDVFISYNTQDRPFAGRLAEDLRSFGLTVWWDQWEMAVGDSLIEKVQEGISRSSWLAVVLSPQSVASGWVRRELAAALAQEIGTQRVFVLPVLVADCQIPPFLADKIYADFRSSYRTGLQSLLRRLEPPIRPEVAAKLMSESDTAVRIAYSRIPKESQYRYRTFLFDKLSSSQVEERLAAMFALSTLRDPELGPRLLTMLKDPSTAVRRRIATNLGRLRSRENLRSIEVLMQDANSAVRSAARSAYKDVTGSRP